MEVFMVNFCYDGSAKDDDYFVYRDNIFYNTLTYEEYVNLGKEIGLLSEALYERSFTNLMNYLTSFDLLDVLTYFNFLFQFIF